MIISGSPAILSTLISNLNTCSLWLVDQLIIINRLEVLLTCLDSTTNKMKIISPCVCVCVSVCVCVCVCVCACNRLWRTGKQWAHTAHTAHSSHSSQLTQVTQHWFVGHSCSSCITWNVMGRWRLLWPLNRLLLLCSRSVDYSPDQHVSEVGKLAVLLVLNLNEPPLGLAPHRLLPPHHHRMVATNHRKWNELLQAEEGNEESPTRKGTRVGY